MIAPFHARKKLVALVSLAGAAVLVVAFQNPRAAVPGVRPNDTGTVDFRTKVGSFKILSPGPKNPAFGKLTMNFQGTVMLAKFEGTVIPSGNLREEYNDPKHGRRVFFGKGRLVLDGKWRSIQFFGRDFVGRWDGYGVMRLYGEFDENRETGTYKVAGFESEAWGSGGMQVILPRSKDTGRSGPKPRVEDVKKPG